jgi:hypothetical protein
MRGLWVWRMRRMRRLVGLRLRLRRRLLHIVGRLPLLLDPTTFQILLLPAEHRCNALGGIGGFNQKACRSGCSAGGSFWRPTSRGEKQPCSVVACRDTRSSEKTVNPNVLTGPPRMLDGRAFVAARGATSAVAGTASKQATLTQFG